MGGVDLRVRGWWLPSESKIANFGGWYRKNYKGNETEFWKVVELEVGFPKILGALEGNQ